MASSSKSAINKCLQPTVNLQDMSAFAPGAECDAMLSMMSAHKSEQCTKPPSQAANLQCEYCKQPSERSQTAYFQVDLGKGM